MAPLPDIVDLFRGGRDRSQCTLPGRERDSIPLPGNDHLYVTHLKGGKPAIGRKKPTTVRQDFVFDILSQTFGVPSRKDFERLPRPLSAASQSSGLVTAPATPRPRQGAQKPGNNHDWYTYEDNQSPMVNRRSSSMRSPSIAVPADMARYNGQDVPQSPGREACSAFPVAQQLGHILVPPPPPPPPRAVIRQRSLIMNNGMAPIPTGHFGVASLPGHPPGRYPDHIITSQGTHSRPNAQQNMVNSYANDHRQFIGPPSFEVNYVPILLNPYPRNAPLPLEPWHFVRESAMSTGRRDTPRQNTTRADYAKTVGEKGHRAESDRGQTRKEPASSQDLKVFSDRIRHVHSCAGCGTKRSRRYQKAHPLKKGEIPPLNYCSECKKRAEETDSDGGISGINVVDHASIGKKHREASRHRPSSDETNNSMASRNANKKPRHDPHGVKKSSTPSPFSRFFPRKARFGHPQPPFTYFSSAEDLPIRASPSESDSRATHSAQKPRIPQKQSTRRKHSNTTTQDRSETSGLRRSSADSWMAKSNSPLIPTDKERPGPRTRVPRVRPQSMTPVDVGSPFSAAAGGLAPVSGGRRSSNHFDSYNSMGFSPIPHSVEVGAFSKSSKQARKATDQVETRRGAGSSNDNLGIPVSAASRARSQGNTDRPAGRPVQGFRSATPKTPLNCDVDTDLEQYEAPYPFPTPDCGTRTLPRDGIPATNDEPAHHYDEPLTPTDVPHAHHFYHPHFVSDSWSGFKSDFERQAEEMAERDLADAGKRFDSLSGCLGGSATSVYPASSFATTNNMSIVSFNPDSEYGGNYAAAVGIEEPELDEDVESDEANGANKFVERIEFSSEEQLRSAESKYAAKPPANCLEHQGGRIAELPTLQDPMYSYVMYDNDEVGYPPSPMGSSVIGHTGHSVDEPVNNTPVHEGPATTAADGHLCRSMRLPSA